MSFIGYTSERVDVIREFALFFTGPTLLTSSVPLSGWKANG